MLIATTKRIENAVIRYDLGRSVTLRHVRWLRGCLSGETDRPEFHQHNGAGFVYQHPLIRYGVFERGVYVMGLGAGAFLLRSLAPRQVLRLGAEDFRVLEEQREVGRFEFGPSATPIIYRFTTPYLALNQENFVAWERSNAFSRRSLLQRIVIGNLLSLSKAVDLDVTERLQADVELEPEGWQELKPGLRLLGFQGAIRVNFRVLDGWGIGKSSARGFGSVMQEEAGHG